MSQEVETQTPLEEANEPTFEPGSEDEAINAFNQRASEANQDAETPEDEPEGEAEEEPEEGDPEEAEPEEQLAEVEYEGKTYKVPPELEKAILRQSDYSRKMNEVSAKEKEYTQRIQQAEALGEIAEKRAEALAEIKSLDAQIDAYSKIDWAKAEAETPAEAALAALKLMNLQNARKEANDKAKAIEQEFGANRQKLHTAKRDEMLAALEKDLKGWGDELGTKITQYAVKSGFTPQEIFEVTDPRWVIAMDKARKFDAIQEGKASIKDAKTKHAPPVAKPGAKRPPVNQAADAMARLTRSKTPEDAIAAFEARAKTR